MVITSPVSSGPSPPKVLKLCTYLASSPSATRVSKRISLVEEYEEEQMRLRSRGWWVVSRSWRPANWWNSWWIIPGIKWLVKEIWAVWQGNNPSQGTNKKPWLQSTSSWQPSPGNFGSFHAPCVTGAGLTGLPKKTAQNTGHLRFFQQRQHFDVNLMARCLNLYGLIKQNVIHSVTVYLHTPIVLIIQKFISYPSSIDRKLQGLLPFPPHWFPDRMASHGAPKEEGVGLEWFSGLTCQ